MLNRRILAKALFALGLCVAAPAMAQLKIGFFATLSGPGAALGLDQLDGFNLGLEQLGEKLGGRDVVVVKEDDHWRPENGVQIVRKFVERDKVDAMVGIGFSNVMNAASRPIAESGVPAIATIGVPSNIAGSSCVKNLFTTAWQSDGPSEAMGKFAHDKGYKRVFLIAPNYPAGKEMLAAFKRNYKGEPIGEVYSTLSQLDYASELTQMTAAKPDAIFAFIPGAMGITFVKQLRQAGFTADSPTQFLSVFTVDATTIPALGHAAAGSITVAMYDSTLPNAENAKFVKAFEEKYKRVPSIYAATGYDAAKLLDKAVASLGKDEVTHAALTEAIKKAGENFTSVRGSFKFNNNNIPIQNYWAFQVSDNNGKITTKPLGAVMENHGDIYHAQCHY